MSFAFVLSALMSQQQQASGGAFGRLKGMFSGQAQEDSARELMNEVIATLRSSGESDRDQV